MPDVARGFGAMAVSEEFFRFVLEQVHELGRVSSRRMFGAVGLCCDGAFFGLISSDVLYFKVGDINRSDYEARGMAQFRPYRDRPQVSMSYYEVPTEVLEDSEECVIWARRSVITADSTTKSRPSQPPKSKRRARPGKHR